MASTLKLYLCRNITHHMSCALAYLALSMYFKYLMVSGLPGGGWGGTPIHYLYRYVPPNGFVILKFPI